DSRVQSVVLLPAATDPESHRSFESDAVTLRVALPRFKWTAGESNPDFLVAGQVSCHWTSSLSFFPERFARESNSVPLLTREDCSQHTREPKYAVGKPSRPGGSRTPVSSL